MSEKTLRFTLPSGEKISVASSGGEAQGDKLFIWGGEVKEKSGYAVLVIDERGKQRTMTGEINLGREAYVIEPIVLGDGKHALVELDTRGESIDNDVYNTKPVKRGAEGAVNIPINMKGTSSSATGPSLLRIIGLYTSKAKNSDPNIENKIRSAFYTANQVLVNSGLSDNLKITTREVRQVNYNESYNTMPLYEEHFDAFYTGNIPDAKAKRDTYGADFIAMFIDDQTTSGLHGQAPVGPAEWGAITFINSASVLHEMTTAHEIGHLLGGKHLIDYPYGGSLIYAYSHYISAIDKSTVLIRGPDGHTRIPYFSDPDLTYQGHSMGVANKSDVVRLVEGTGNYRTTFRDDPNLFVYISGNNNPPLNQQTTWTANWWGGGVEYPTFKWYTKPPGYGSWTRHYQTNGTWAWKIITAPLYVKVEIYDDVHFVTSQSFYVYPVGNGYKAVESPKEFLVLQQNYPNPFNPTTTIRFELLEESRVSLSIFNMNGQEVAKLANGILASGTHTINWDASALPNGVYYYQVKAGGEIQSKRMTLMK